jgi:tetratricopeptide (TPR) repeat protein
MAKIPFFKTHTNQGKFKESLDKLQYVLFRNPDDLRIRVKIAELYLEYGKKEEAIAEFLTAARAYQAKRLSRIALSIYNRAISIDPDQVDLYTELANFHLVNGFIGDAVSVLEKLANHFYEKKLNYEAVQVLHKIHEIDPDNEFFKIKIAKFYQGKDWQLADQKDAAEARIAVSQGDFDLHHVLDSDADVQVFPPQNPAGASDGQGTSPDDVFNQLKKIVENTEDMDSPHFHFNFGLVYMRFKEFNEAISEFSAALAGLDNKTECYVKLSECHMALGRFDLANDLIEKALKLKNLAQQDRLSLIYQTALVYKGKGDLQKALKAFQRVYDSDSRFKSVDTEIKNLQLGL